MNTHLFLTKRKTRQFQQPPSSSMAACFTPLKNNHNKSALVNFSTFHEESTSFGLDSIEVDYRQKCFQFMKKNTELQLNMRQSKSDIEHLQKQVQKFKQIVTQLATIFAGGQFANSLNEEIVNKQKGLNIKKSLSNLLKEQNIKPESLLIRPVPQRSLSQSLCQIAVQNSRGHTMKMKQQNEACDCQHHFSQIINEYKSIMDVQHSNIEKKQKTNKLMKKEIESYKRIIEELKKSHEEDGKTIEQMQQKLNDQYLKEEQVKKSIQKNKEVEKRKEQKMKELQSQREENLKKIQSLIGENQQLFKQKQKVKSKYKQEIIHFEEMEKLVEEKLIQVEYQMNFYKKERIQNFSKIRKLQEEIKDLRNAEEKKYYSFGDSQKDAWAQVSISDQSEESQAEIIISMDKTVIRRQPQEEGEKRVEKKSSIQQRIPTKQKTQQKTAADNWQMECYEQSIKTLLLENNRLKQSLIKLYKYKKGQTSIQLDEEVEVQLKILLSLGEDAERQAQIVEDSKKGRKFIKEV